MSNTQLSQSLLLSASLLLVGPALWANPGVISITTSSSPTITFSSPDIYLGTLSSNPGGACGESCYSILGSGSASGISIGYYIVTTPANPLILSSGTPFSIDSNGTTTDFLLSDQFDDSLFGTITLNSLTPSASPDEVILQGDLNITGTQISNMLVLGELERLYGGPIGRGTIATLDLTVDCATACLGSDPVGTIKSFRIANPGATVPEPKGNSLLVLGVVLFGLFRRCRREAA